MANLMLAYCVTHQDRLIRRFAEALRMQSIIDKIEIPQMSADNVLIADTDADNIPEEIMTYFGGNVVTTDPYVHMGDDRHFCLAKFRNKSIEIALERGYEWMMFCDCDTVILHKPFIEPKRKQIGIPRVYWQKSADESIEDSLSAVSTLGAESFSKSNSWFILHNDTMRKFRLNENIYGYGYEDVEFSFRLKSGGCKLDITDNVVIHAFHSSAERTIISKLFTRNRDITEASKILMALGFDPSNLPDIDIIQARHPNWSGSLAVMAAERRVLQIEKRCLGSYRVDGDGLTIKWDEAAEELFRRQDSVFHFVAQSSS